jgi:hypothetical protein
MYLVAVDRDDRKVNCCIYYILSPGVTWPAIAVTLPLAAVILAALLWGKEGAKWPVFLPATLNLQIVTRKLTTE